MKIMRGLPGRVLFGTKGLTAPRHDPNIASGSGSPSDQVTVSSDDAEAVTDAGRPTAGSHSSTAS
ncbi:hypothetical protein ACFPM0_17460 [Pseudonocardia sulfidoxydans]